MDDTEVVTCNSTVPGDATCFEAHACHAGPDEARSILLVTFMWQGVPNFRPQPTKIYTNFLQAETFVVQGMAIAEYEPYYPKAYYINKYGAY